MSWRSINYILGLAATDPAFFQQLQADPQKALAGHELDLTPHELAVLQQISVTSLAEFSRQLIDKLGPQTENSEFN